MDTSRTSNSLKNMAFGVGSQMLSILMGFFTRWMFIALLWKEYLGVSGLFTNVLSLLSLANLGFDTAIIYSLYKPLAEGDMVAVKGYMRVYKRVYSIVGVTVFVLGCILMPFLPYLINGEVTIPGEHKYYLYSLSAASQQALLFLLQAVSFDGQPTEPDQFPIPFDLYGIAKFGRDGGSVFLPCIYSDVDLYYRFSACRKCMDCKSNG